MIAAPLFHSWGFAHFALGHGAGLDARAAAEVRPRGHAVGDRPARVHARSSVVPVMLQRILELPDEVIDRYDLSLAARDRRSAARRCPASLAERSLERFGDVLYNLYGSTEVAWATIATPEDLRAAPGTAGRPPRGTVVRIFDDDGQRAVRRARPAASSSATRCCSRATPAAAARTSSTG